MRLALLVGLRDAGVEAVDVAHADLRHLAVAVLHLAHGPFQRDDGLLRIGDDGRQQMRDAVIDGQFEHLRVDHDQPAFLRRHAVEQRQDHGVDGDRLARAGGAGDQHVRHLGDVDDDRLAVDRLAERQRQLGLGRLEVAAGEDLAQIDGLALGVGQFDADGVAAGHDGDARGDRAHRAGDVVGKADDARRLDAGRRLQFVERDDRTGADMDDLALDAEILQHAFEQARILFQRVLRQASCRARRSSARSGNAGSASRSSRGRSARSAPRAGRGRPGTGRGAGPSTRAAPAGRAEGLHRWHSAGASVLREIVHRRRSVVHRPVEEHRRRSSAREEFRLDAARRAMLRLGALGRFDPLGGTAPAAGAFAAVGTRSRRGSRNFAAVRRAKARARQPPMGDGAERQDARRRRPRHHRRKRPPRPPDGAPARPSRRSRACGPSAPEP